MRHTLTALLSAASICAFACAVPTVAWAEGGDANAEADQAQLHPWSADQTPDWTPYGVPMGEVYEGVPVPAYVYAPPPVVAPVIVPTVP